MNGRPPVVVVGGGVIGLGVAYELLARGRAVTLVERNRPGGSATGAAAGMLAPVSEAAVETDAQLRFGLESLERFPDFVRRVERASGLDCGLRRDGTLWVALGPDEQGELDHLAETLRERDLEHERLSAAALRDREPHLASRLSGGLLVRGDLQVDPRRLAAALEAACGGLGGRIEHGIRVREVRAEEGRVTAVEGREAGGGAWGVETDTVVVCAGPWSSSEGPGIRLPLPPLGLRPVKGQLLRLRGPVLLRHVVRHPEGYLVPRADGELLVGASMEELGFDERPGAGVVLDLLRHAWRVLPGLYDLELCEISVGLRSAVDDQLPVIGRSSVDGLHLATGHFRNGILLAPATAHHLAEAIVSGRVPSEIAPFDPRRLEPARRADAAVGKGGPR